MLGGTDKLGNPKIRQFNFGQSSRLWEDLIAEKTPSGRKPRHWITDSRWIVFGHLHVWGMRLSMIARMSCLLSLYYRTTAYAVQPNQEACGNQVQLLAQSANFLISSVPKLLKCHKDIRRSQWQIRLMVHFLTKVGTARQRGWAA